MKLELPDDNATVLYHMGEALRNIAIDNGHAVPVLKPSVKTTVTNTVGDVSRTVTNESLVAEEVITPPEAEFTEQDVVEHEGNANDNPSVTNDTIDANGLPWDQRIHSRGKTRLADDTWRKARKPNDKTDDEWSAYVEEVEAELRTLMEIPVATGEEVVTPPTLDEAAVADTISAEQAFSTPPVVTETPPVVTETPPVVTETPPVVTETPPVVTETPPVVTETPSVSTFPELMKFITSNNKKLDKDTVNGVLSDNGLASITLLAARTDLIPQIHATLLKVIG